MEVFIISSCRDEINADYIILARKIAKFLAENECNLIFGGASTSMMGVCYKVFEKYQRNISVYTTPEYLEDLKNLPAAKGYIYRTSFERLQHMYEACDLLVVLPGGPGTIAELTSCIDEKRSNGKNVPIIIYDENEYYKKLLEIYDKFIEEKFCGASIKDTFIYTQNMEEFTNAYYECQKNMKK